METGHFPNISTWQSVVIDKKEADFTFQFTKYTVKPFQDLIAPYYFSFI